MAGEWEGKSKGTVLGYRIFIFFIKKLGVRAAYGLLVFVAFYYYLFAGSSTKSIYYYLNKRLQYSKIKSLFGIYKSYFVFGKTIIDKVAISSGLKDQFTYEFDGIEKITELLDKKKGGILISAHVGNFETAEFFFEEIDTLSQISLVITDREHRQIREYMEKVTTHTNLKFIVMQGDLSHIFEINNALNNNEIICFTGDRYMPGAKTLRQSFLGKETDFPAGPFLLASRLKVPVLFVYVMKETNKHYHLYAQDVEFKNRNAQDLLDKYAKSVENILEKYPLQWFNYFNFWNKNEQN